MKVISFVTRNVIAPIILAAPLATTAIGITVGAANALTVTQDGIQGITDVYCNPGHQCKGMNQVNAPLTTVDEREEIKGIQVEIDPPMTTVPLDVERVKHLIYSGGSGQVPDLCSPGDQREGC